MSILKITLCGWFVTDRSNQNDNLETTVVGLLDLPPEVWLSHYPYMEGEVEQASLARLCTSCKQAYTVFVPVLYSTIWLGSMLNFQDAWVGRVRVLKLIRTLNERPELGQHVRELDLGFSGSEFELEQGYEHLIPPHMRRYSRSST